MILSIAGILQNNSAVSLKTKHASAVWARNYAHGLIFQKLKSLYSHKNTICINVSSSFVYNNPKLEITQKSFNGWKTQWPGVIHTRGIIQQYNNIWGLTIDIHDNLYASLRYLEWKKPTPKLANCITLFPARPWNDELQKWRTDEWLPFK